MDTQIFHFNQRFILAYFMKMFASQGHSRTNVMIWQKVKNVDQNFNRQIYPSIDSRLLFSSLTVSVFSKVLLRLVFSLIGPACPIFSNFLLSIFSFLKCFQILLFCFRSFSLLFVIVFIQRLRERRKKYFRK